LLRDFYVPFERDLTRAKVEMRDIKREEEPTEEVCEKCGKPMVIKWGRNGHFLACSGYPECRNTKEYTRNPDGTLDRAAHHAAVGPDLPDLQLAHGDQARSLRRVPGVLALSRLQDHQPHLAGRDLPEAELRRLPHREALEARQGLLRLFELRQVEVRFRVVGSPHAQAVPAVWRGLHRAEGLALGHAPALHRRGLRLRTRARPWGAAEWIADEG
jgi:ssDNA-binding Zn-finger/Zn-ribbon topoisomerase 1